MKLILNITRRRASTLVVAGGLLVLTLIPLSGCGTQKGTTLVKLERDTKLTEDSPREVEARDDGTVALYASNDMTPKVTYPVKKGDKLGFRRGDDGSIIAFAGDNETQVESDPVFERTFYWKFQDEE